MNDYEAVRAQLASLPNVKKGTGASEAELRELGEVWGPLPVDFKQYLEEFGWATVGSYELFGLGQGVPPHLNILDRSRELWQGDGDYQLPTTLLPAYDSGGGWLYCVSKIHPGQPIVVWAQEYEDAGEPQPYDEQYPSWSTWMLDHVLTPTKK